MKEEYLVRIMETRKLDAYIIQEMHLAGDYIKIIGEKKYYMIHHGPEEQPRSGAKGGVTIVLSEEMANHWIKGESKIKYGGIMAGKMTRLLGIDIKIKLIMLNKNKAT